MIVMRIGKTRENWSHTILNSILSRSAVTPVFPRQQKGEEEEQEEEEVDVEEEGGGGKEEDLFTFFSMC